ncbi:RICIN domain-containing protein [Pendulispora brunnea]|uniref:RICIN domain-containing protein n=1 Tax=Pendulispora brunnea TaxID=2905690 RepID=A0ABZ2JUF1_9BACT
MAYDTHTSDDIHHRYVTHENACRVYAQRPMHRFAILLTTFAALANDPPKEVPLIFQSVPNGLVADVSGAEMKQGQTILEYGYAAAKNQQWWLQQNGTHYKIKSNVDGAWCMTRSADGNLAKVVLGGCDTYLADWDVLPLGGERYRIKDPNGAFYLHVQNETPTSGRELVTSTNDAIGSEWYLTGLTVPRRAMPSEPRLDQVTFLTTHNAFANTDEGFWGRFPNQSYGLRSQLDQGVRAMQLDVYAYNGGVRMCHGSCWGNERTFGAGLADVLAFLNANPSAIVTLFLEDYTTVDELRASVESVAGLSNMIFRPDQSGVRQNGWPTVSQLIAQNRRLLIFSQRPGREGFGVMYDRDWTVENYWSLTNSGNDMRCYSRWGEVPLGKEEPGFVRLHVMNQYRDIPSEGNAGADNGSKLRDRVERYCGPIARRKPNYVAVDFFQKPEGGATKSLISEMNTYW